MQNYFAPGLLSGFKHLDGKVVPLFYLSTLSSDTHSTRSAHFMKAWTTYVYSASSISKAWGLVSLNLTDLQLSCRMCGMCWIYLLAEGAYVPTIHMLTHSFSDLHTLTNPRWRNITASEVTVVFEKWMYLTNPLTGTSLSQSQHFSSERLLAPLSNGISSQHPSDSDSVNLWFNPLSCF